MPPRPRKKAAAPRESAAKKNCKFHCCVISDERKAEIAESAEASRGQSMFPDDGTTTEMCRCGVPRKPPGLAKYIVDDGLCVVHPDNPPQPWVRGAERHG